MKDARWNKLAICAKSRVHHSKIKWDTLNDNDTIFRVNDPND